MESVFVIASTHWDREWYRTYSEFRIRLCDMFSNLLESLEQDQEFSCFTFDGQCIILEDFLEIYPHERERVKRLIEQGKIVVGPSYVIPDELIPSGEGLIKNYQIGHRICKGFGNKSNCAYLPDNFGHTSQMPQIINQFDMDSALFLRGIDMDTSGACEFIWEGPDESRVLSNHLILGYWSLKSWGKLSKSPQDHFKEATEQIRKFSSIKTYLLINGSDHLYYDPEMTNNIKLVQKSFPNLQIKNSSIDEFMSCVKQQVDYDKLKIVKGELRYGKDSCLNESCTSARYDIKYQNNLCETELEKYTQPLATISYLQGNKYPKELIDFSWKTLVQNYPHDSICACSSDETHQDVMHRYKIVKENAVRLSELAVEKIANNTYKSTMGSIFIYNPLGWKRDDIVTVEIDVPVDKKPRDIEVLDQHGNKVDYELISVDELYTLKEFLYTSKEKTKIKRFKVSFVAKDIPAVGYAIYTYKSLELRDKRRYQQLKMTRNTSQIIENEHFKITPQANGGITILDKKTNKVYYDMNMFEDRGDSGDEYQAEIPFRDTTVFANLKSVTVIENTDLMSTLKLSLELLLPKGIDKDYFSRKDECVSCNIETYISLYRNVRRIDIKTKFENKVTDHILSVRFNTQIKSEHDYAHMPFDIVKRKVEVKEVEESDNEILTPYKPMHTFVDIYDKEYGLSVATKGIYEYTCKQGEGGLDLSVTLLRCTGWLFRETRAASRDGQPCTTPIVSTPDAQNLGNQVFEYSLGFHQGEITSSDTHKQMFDFKYPLRCVSVENEICNKEYSLVEIDNSNIVVSAVEKSEYDESIIVRCYNISENELDANMQFGFEVESIKIVNMLERNVSDVMVKDNKITLHFKPKKIITLKVTKK